MKFIALISFSVVFMLSCDSLDQNKPISRKNSSGKIITAQKVDSADIVITAKLFENVDHQLNQYFDFTSDGDFEQLTELYFPGYFKLQPRLEIIAQAEEAYNNGWVNVVDGYELLYLTPFVTHGLYNYASVTFELKSRLTYSEKMTGNPENYLRIAANSYGKENVRLDTNLRTIFAEGIQKMFVISTLNMDTFYFAPESFIHQKFSKDYIDKDTALKIRKYE